MLNYLILKHNKKPLIISVCLGILDNILKTYIRSNDFSDLVIIENVLEIDLNYNTGIAFGFLKEQASFTFILSVTVLIWLIFQFKNKFKKRLEAEREQLLSMLEQHQEEREKIRLSEASAERSPDPSSADGGSMAFELEKELTLDENTRHLLNQIEHALVLIKKKKYGNCENCGEPIPVARLEALPYATMRKECAEALES